MTAFVRPIVIVSRCLEFDHTQGALPLLRDEERQGLSPGGEGRPGRLPPSRLLRRGRPVEDEGRLGNFTLRGHFLTVLFARARLRTVREGGRMKELIAFHSDYKYLLMASSEADLRKLGFTVANRDRGKSAEVMAEYESRSRSSAPGSPASERNTSPGRPFSAPTRKSWSRSATPARGARLGGNNNAARPVRRFTPLCRSPRGGGGEPVGGRWPAGV